MTNLAAQVSTVAMLALAALPMAALPAAAFAAPASASVRIADINVLSDAGMQTFQRRADYAARDFCQGEKDLHLMAVCRKAIKQEFNEKVAVVRAAKLEQVNTTFAAR